jgi:hypothetical protein
MPGDRAFDDSEGVGPHLSLGQRLLAALPRLRHDGPKAPLVERFKEAVVKPVEPSAAALAKAADVPMTIEELEAANKSADDKERLVGLLLAPLAAAIGIIISNVKIAGARSALLSNGKINPQHHNLSTYDELELVFLALAVLMLGTAFYRKRLALGIVTALYGLSLFNLPPYWGFGFPYLLAGAWLLVHAYRLQRDLKVAKGEAPSRYGPPGGSGATGAGRPRPNKRYTPPTAPTPPRRSTRAKSKSKPEDEKRAG